MTFRRSFTVGKSNEFHPPGSYMVQTDEEMIPGLSFPAWRRIVTMMHVRGNGAMQVHIIDPDELELSLSRDAAEASTV